MKASQNKDGPTYKYLHQEKENYEKNPKSTRASFVSFRFLDKILSVLKTYVQRKIKNEIIDESNGKFAIQLDTSTDRSTAQQCCIVARYTMKDLTVKERIITFLSIANSTGVGIHKFLAERLSELGLDIKNVIASCTDGASNMMSKNVGVTGLIQKLNPRHVVTWCVCHRFNLVIEDSLKNCAHIVTLISSISTFGGFIRASPNRMKDWQATISAFSTQFKDVDKRVRPPQTNATRWWSKYKTVRFAIQSTSSFLGFYTNLLNLNELKNKLKWSRNQIESIKKLNSIWKANPANIGILYGVHIILERLHSTMQHLQTSGLPISDVQSSIKSCYRYLDALNSDNK